MTNQEIRDVITNFCKERKAENGHNIIFGIKDWDNHFMSESWAVDAGTILAVVFLGNNEKFIVDFIAENSQIHELEDNSIIYELLSKTVVYNAMQIAKKTASNHSKSEVLFPGLKAYEKKESAERIKEKARKKANELLKYIQILGTEDTNKMGHMLIDFINNTDKYFTKKWKIPSVTSQELAEYLDTLQVSSEEKSKYLTHFKL